MEKSFPIDENQNIKNCLSAFHDQLKNQLEPQICKNIADSFRYKQLLEEEKANEIARSSNGEVVEKFLDILHESTNLRECYSCFLEELNNYELEYISGMLEGTISENVFMIPWQQALGKHYSEFITQFDPRYILNINRDLLDQYSRQVVLEQGTQIGRSHKFFYYLPKRPDWFPKFIAALKDDENGNLDQYVDLLDPEGNLQEMAFQNLIQVCSEEIKKTLEPNDIIDCMQCFPEASKEFVKCKRTRKDRVEAFLSLLRGNPLNWFKEFIDALYANEKYSELCDLLEPSQTVKPSSSSSKQNNMGVGSCTVSGSTGGAAGGDDLLKDPNILGMDISQLHGNVHEEGRNDKQSDKFGSSAVQSVTNEAPTSPQHAEASDSGLSNLNMLEKHEMEDTEKEKRKFSPRQTQRSVSPNELTSSPSERQNNRKVVSLEQKNVYLPQLELRDYQKELASPALEGKNCMIVAPTGSGKTYVAIAIGLHHLKETQKAKIIFLVPRVPLVQQQYNLFKSLLGNEQSIIFQVTGESGSSVPVHVSVQKHSVIVMTAQILVNLLGDGLMEIGEISLLIFDECHHAVKRDPYNAIMRMYLDKKLSEENHDGRLPQVIGLTASPGMGKAKTMKIAQENIKTLMANLDITTAPVQVSKATDNLLDFQHEAQDVVIPVQKRQNDVFGDRVKKIMLEIEKCIARDISRYENVLDDRIKFDLRAVPGSQDYEAWVVNLLNKSKLIRNDEPSQYFMAYAKHLREYNNALMLNDHVRSVDAMDYIDEHLFDKKPRNPVEENMLALFNRNEPQVCDNLNPLLECLTQELKREFDKNPSSRCILFVKTRAIAKGLLTYMTEDVFLKGLGLNPKQLTGSGARRDNFGMTKVGQEDVLKAFKDGSCKLLVATSVAEEGLDIKECNLIITYNYSNNEVGQVQRKGRGRAKESKVIMLAYDDSGHVKRERENKIRVELTQDILSHIQSLDQTVLKSEILKIQAEAKKEREFERTVQKYKAKKNKADPGVFRLSCIWCKKVATTSDKLRHIKGQHRVVVDKEFDKKFIVRDVPDTSEERLIEDDVDLIGKIYCKNKQCDREWGSRMRYKDFPISVPSISSFVITNQKGYRAVKQHWKSAPFQVNKDLTEADLQTLTDF